MADHHRPTPLDRRIFARYLAPGELLTGVVHRHWVALIAPLGESLLFGVLFPTIAFWAFIGSSWWVLFGLALWVIGGVVWSCYAFYDWYCDAFLLTESHLVLLAWKNLISMSSDRINYQSIESVQHSRSGIPATILRYGRLEVITANATHVLSNARHPQSARDLLQAAQGRQEESGNEPPADVEALRQALKSLLAEREGEHAEHQLDPQTPYRPEPPRMNDVTPPPA